MPDRDIPLGDKVYVELVRSLYARATPSVIMTAAFVAAVMLIYEREGGPFTLAAGIAGMAVSVVRLTTVFWLRRKALTASLDRTEARRLEVQFAVPYVSFAFCLGLFGVCVFALRSPEAHMVTICLLMGYGAGVATGAGLRPYIAIPSMMLATVPTAIAAIGRGEAIYIGVAGISLAFLTGGIQTVIARSASVQAEIAKRLTFGSLARSDGLTELPNRLALREYFEENAALLAEKALIAVHYIDLDRFKPVNDRYGHAVGDALLSTVGERLTNAIRNGDLAARLGGDEFAVLQFGLAHAEQAEFLSQRIQAAISQPFRIDNHTIEISCSIGAVTTADRTLGLDELLHQADQKLYAAKRGRRSAKAAA